MTLRREQYIGWVEDIDRKEGIVLLKVPTDNETKEIEVGKKNFRKGDWSKVRRGSVITITLWDNSESLFSIRCSVRIGRKPVTQKERKRLGEIIAELGEDNGKRKRRNSFSHKGTC